jgi:hypothetical protein
MQQEVKTHDSAYSTVAGSSCGVVRHKRTKPLSQVSALGSRSDGLVARLDGLVGFQHCPDDFENLAYRLNSLISFSWQAEASLVQTQV